jgi:hypothetical protein
MAGLVPVIHVFIFKRQNSGKTWMPGIKPRMTSK